MQYLPRLLAIGALSLTCASAVPAAAQDQGGGDDFFGDGLDLFEQGAELFLRGLMDEIGPQLEQLKPQFEGMADQIAPMITALLELVDEIDAYHAPEMLPNGDIILRRKDPSETQPAPLDPPSDGEIDI
ncbi:MAG: hypothetical protein AAGG09_21590 [Pseudomonadota bacterium]